MKWKNRLTNYNFWISIISAVLLILQAFNINFDIAYINEIATAVLGLLVVIGIISDPTKTTTSQTITEQISTEQQTETEATEIANQTLPSNAENETDNVGSESNFQAIVSLISSEIEKAFKQNNIKHIQESNETTQTQEQTPNFPNIVN